MVCQWLPLLFLIQDLLKNSNLARLLFEGVVQLQDPYHMSVAMQDLEKSVHDGVSLISSNRYFGP